MYMRLSEHVACRTWRADRRYRPFDLIRSLRGTITTERFGLRRADDVFEVCSLTAAWGISFKIIASVLMISLLSLSVLAPEAVLLSNWGMRLILYPTTAAISHLFDS